MKIELSEDQIKQILYRLLRDDKWRGYIIEEAELIEIQRSKRLAKVR